MRAMGEAHPDHPRVLDGLRPEQVDKVIAAAERLKQESPNMFANVRWRKDGRLLVFEDFSQRPDR